MPDLHSWRGGSRVCRQCSGRPPTRYQRERREPARGLHTPTFIDSTGVRALVDARSLLESNGRTLTIVNLAPGPQRVFEILGLTDLFNIERISAS
jgi:hypothetical protein